VANELVHIDEWITSVLTADTALTDEVGDRIYAGQAPEQAAFPFVLFNQQSAIDVLGVGAVRIFLNATYLVRVVGDTESYVSLRPAADRIDALLHDVRAVVPDGHVLFSVREQGFSMVESTELPLVQYRHLGAIFRIGIRIED